jgi:shikimate dehydrogenase
LAVAPANLEQALKDLPSHGFSGVNLTIPHKEAALKIVDHADPLAKRIGAVNTVIVRGDKTLEGFNTDAYGFTQNLLAAGFKPSERPAVVIGAGGASRAVVVALLDLGFSEIRIVNRTQSRAEALAQVFGKALRVFPWSDYLRTLPDAALLVNTTSLGMQGQPPLEITLDELPRDALVNDLVYAPLMTDLLRRAQQRGNRFVDGLGMLLHQARPAFAAWFGREPEVTEELRTFVLQPA